MARTNYPSDKQDQFVLRLPDGMRDRVKTAAYDNSRSMNAEIVARIEAAESIPRVLADFDLAKERILSAQKQEQSLKSQVEMLHQVTVSAQEINRRLIDILMNRLGVSTEEISEVTTTKSSE